LHHCPVDIRITRRRSAEFLDVRSGNEHPRLTAFENQAAQIDPPRKLRDHRLEFAKNGLTERVCLAARKIKNNSSDAVGDLEAECGGHGQSLRSRIGCVVFVAADGGPRRCAPRPALLNYKTALTVSHPGNNDFTASNSSCNSLSVTRNFAWPNGSSFSPETTL